MDNGIYILTSEDDLITHEKALYRNFYRLYPEYSRRFFKLIDKNRLQPLLPYTDQVIIGVKHAGMLLAAGSFCINSSQTFIVEKIGFTIPKSTSICEGLQFYSTIAENVGFNMTIYKELLTFGFNEMLNRNITTIYSSCDQRRLKLYKYIGFETIDEIIFDKQKEYLIKKEITPDFEQSMFDLKRIQS